MDLHLGASNSPRESLKEAFRLCQKAIALDDRQDMPHYLLGHIYALSGKFDEAITEGELAIALNPNSATAYDYLGRTLTYAGRAEEAIPLIKDGLRLNPLAGTTLTLGNALRETGQYEAALAEYKKVIEGRPNKIIAYQCLSVTYAMSGSFEEARKAWSEVLKLDPRMTVEKNFAKPWPYGPEHRQRLISAMHQAGID